MKWLSIWILLTLNIFAQGYGNSPFGYSNLGRYGGARITIYDIGVPGAQSFGVGNYSGTLPSGFSKMTGTDDPTSDNFGNYVYSDGSVMVYIPKFYYRIGSVSNPTYAVYGVNSIDVRGTGTFPTEAAALANGYVIHRAFIDGGITHDGVFVDKYKWSLTNFSNGVSGIASSIKNGNPISSSVSTNRDATNNFAGSFSDCISNSQTPTNTYGGAWAVAKSRGANFAVMSIFIADGLAKLSMAHGQASSATTNCAWYSATTTNFPKGMNTSGSLRDTDDNSCTFTACDDGYWAGRNEAAKVGSGNAFAKTTHNGQACGVSDINGNQYEIVQGLSAVATAYTIDAVSGDGTYVTIQTTAAHGLAANNWVMITELTGEGINDKIWKVYDAPTGTTIRIESTETAFTDVSGSLTKANFYVLHENVDLKTVTGGNSSATTDQFADAFLADPSKNRSVSLQFASGRAFVQSYGNSTNAVFDFSTDKTSEAYKRCNAGLPALSGVSSGGTDLYGKDYFYQYIKDELCPVRFGFWSDGTIAGVWSLYLRYSRTSSATFVSGRSCLYVY